MPTFLTGRERLLVFEGAFGGTISGDYYSIPMPPHWDRYTTRHGVAGPLFSVDARGSVPDFGYSSYIEYSQSLTVTLGAGLPSGGTSGSVSTAGTVFSPGPLSISGNGSFNLTIPVQECVTIDIGGTPAYGGSAVLDYPAYTPARFFQRPKVGGTASCSVVFGGLTVTLSKVIGTADGTVVLSDDGQISADVYSTGKLGTATTSGTLLGEAITVPLSGSNSHGSFDTSSLVQAVTLGSASHTSASARRWVTRRYRLDGVVRNLAGSALSGVVDCQWTPRGSAEYLAIPDGTIGTAWTAERYAAQGLAGLSGSESSIGSASVNEHGSVRCWISTAWLSASGEDLADWRMLQRGRIFGSISFVHAGTTVIDGGFSHTGGGTTTRTYGTVRVLNSYRYLDFLTDRPSDNTFQCRIGTKTFSGSADITGRIRFDLCAPTNGTVQADGMDSRFPMPTQDNALGSPGCFWGVTQAGTIQLIGGSAGPVSVGTVALVRVGTARISFAPEFRRHHQRYLSGGGSVHRLALAEVDGKLSLELLDGFAGFDLSIGSAGTLVNELGTAAWDAGATVWAGWSASLSGLGSADGSDYTDWGTAYLNVNRPASWIGGRELLRRGTVWEQFLAGDVGTIGGIPVQVLVDSVEVYGASGDCWGLTGTAFGTAPHPVDVAHIFRGLAQGIVYGTGVAPAVGVTVSVKETSGGSGRGSGSSDGLGIYMTGSPGGIGQVVHDVYPTVGGTVTKTFYSRGLHRAVMRYQPNVDWPSYDVSISQRHLRGYLLGTDLQIGYGLDVQASTWSDRSSGLTLSEPCVRIERNSVEQKLWLLGRQGTAIVSAYSLDEGATWLMAGTVTTSGSFPELVITRDGRRCCYWYSGGTIYGRIYDAVGNSLVGPFVAVSGGAAEKFAVAEHAVGAGSWRIHMVYRTTGGVLVDLESVDGTAFF